MKSTAEIVSEAMALGDKCTQKQLEYASGREATIQEMAVIDKIYRHFAHMLAIQRATNQDPDAFLTAVWWITSVIQAEMMLAVFDNSKVIEQADGWNAVYTNFLMETIEVNVAQRAARDAEAPKGH